MSMTHHISTKVLTTWFLNLPRDESIDNKKHKVWRSNQKPYEAQLEDQKPTKSSRRSSRRRKSRKTNKSHEKRQASQKGKEELRKARNQNRTSKKSSNSKTPLESTPPNTLNASYSL
jgi:hypothetical protein